MESNLKKKEFDQSPKSAEMLERELEEARAKLYDSQNVLKDQRAQLSQEQVKNSELKGQASRWNDGPNSPSVTKFDLQSENNELERRLRELETELRLERANLAGGSLSPASPRALESRYQDADPNNFLHRNQATQLEHLQNLKGILEEESGRMRERVEAKILPNETDLLQLRSNMSKVRHEIDSILRAKVRLNERYNNMVGRIDLLQRENESLRSSQSRASDTSHLADISRELANRNAKITELTGELAMVKTLLSRQVSSSDLVSELLGLRRELDARSNRIHQMEQTISNHLKTQLNLSQANQNLSTQLADIKSQIDAIDIDKIKKDMADAAAKIAQTRPINTDTRIRFISSSLHKSRSNLPKKLPIFKEKTAN